MMVKYELVGLLKRVDGKYIFNKPPFIQGNEKYARIIIKKTKVVYE